MYTLKFPWTLLFSNKNLSLSFIVISSLIFFLRCILKCDRGLISMFYIFHINYIAFLLSLLWVTGGKTVACVGQGSPEIKTNELWLTSGYNLINFRWSIEFFCLRSSLVPKKYLALAMDTVSIVLSKLIEISYKVLMGRYVRDIKLGHRVN